jgi:hypothetical protein
MIILKIYVHTGSLFLVSLGGGGGGDDEFITTDIQKPIKFTVKARISSLFSQKCFTISIRIKTAWNMSSDFKSFVRGSLVFRVPFIPVLLEIKCS